MMFNDGSQHNNAPDTNATNNADNNNNNNNKTNKVETKYSEKKQQ